jgi:hypothetical protein
MFRSDRASRSELCNYLLGCPHECPCQMILRIIMIDIGHCASGGCSYGVVFQSTSSAKTFIQDRQMSLVGSFYSDGVIVHILVVVVKVHTPWTSKISIIAPYNGDHLIRS